MLFLFMLFELHICVFTVYLKIYGFIFSGTNTFYYSKYLDCIEGSFIVLFGVGWNCWWSFNTFFLYLVFGYFFCSCLYSKNGILSFMRWRRKKASKEHFISFIFCFINVCGWAIGMLVVFILKFFVLVVLLYYYMQFNPQSFLILISRATSVSENICGIYWKAKYEVKEE